MSNSMSRGLSGSVSRTSLPRVRARNNLIVDTEHAYAHALATAWVCLSGCVFVLSQFS